MDTANGSARPMPWNRIELYISRPSGDSVLSNMDNELESVFTHEYTHILNMDSVKGFGLGLRYVVGRVFFSFPNIFTPIWVLEGNAVYSESSGGLGRNNSAWADMVIRTDVLSGNIKSIAEASTFPREWPQGNVPYLYGGFFVDYLEKNYGAGSFEYFLKRNSDNIIPFSDNIYPIPYFFNKDAKAVYGKSFSELWKNFEQFLGRKYTAQANEIKQKPLSNYEVILEDMKTFPKAVFGENSNIIYYFETPASATSSLTKANIETGKKETLCEINYPEAISFENGSIYYTDLEIYRNYSAFSDIYSYNGKCRRLTEGKRIRSGESLGNNRFIYITNLSNEYSLIISDTSFENKLFVIEDSDYQIESLKISPDKSKALFVFKDKSERDIAIIDLKTFKIERITKQSGKNITPAWHPDSSRILFSSEKTGVYNIYEYNIKSKTLSLLTNFLTGAFYPAVSPDGKSILFSLYSKAGYSLAKMAYPEQKLSVEQLTSDEMPVSFAEKSKENIDLQKIQTEEKNYNPFPTILPSSFFPYYFTTEIYPKKYENYVGAITFGADTLYNHIYSLYAFISTKEYNLNLAASYLYGGFFPNFFGTYTDNTISLGKDEFPYSDEENRYEILRTRSRQFQAGVMIPIIKLRSYNIFQASYIYEKDVIDYSDGYTSVEHEEPTLAKINGAWDFSNTKSYTWSVSPEHGRNISLIGDYYHKNLGSNYSFYKARGEYSEYLPGLAKNNALMLRMRGGYAKVPKEVFNPYNTGRFAKGKTHNAETDEDLWGLRGYPAGFYYGTKIATATMEYRIPIFQKDAAFKTFPLMFRDLWLNPFTECGSIWRENDWKNKFRYSAGMELFTKLTTGYQYDLIGYLGAAKGFGKDGQTQIYFGIGSFIDGAINDKRLEYTRPR